MHTPGLKLAHAHGEVLLVPVKVQLRAFVGYVVAPAARIYFNAERDAACAAVVYDCPEIIGLPACHRGGKAQRVAAGDGGYDAVRGCAAGGVKAAACAEIAAHLQIAVPAAAVLAGKAYTFEVAAGSNKVEIKKAVEELFGVKVAKVNTMNVRGRQKRVGRYTGKTAAWKKAIVTLTEKSKTIEFFDGLM